MTDTTKAPKTVQPIKLKSLADGQAVTFPLTLQLKRLDGALLELTLTMQAHGKRAWSAIKDKFYADLRADAAARTAAEEGKDADAAELDETATLASRVGRSIENDARLVLQIAKGWDVDDEFTAEALEELEDRFGGALGEIVTRYDRAIYQGQLGN